MQDAFLTTFKRIIRECNYDNTYKMAMAKALVELSLTTKSNDEYVVYTMETLAEKYLKYYWNQTIFFDLVQGSNLRKTPVILQLTKELINDYYTSTHASKPERFEKVQTYLEEKLTTNYHRTIKQIGTAITKDVAYRFIILNGESHEEVYSYDTKSHLITIKVENLKELKENNEDLFDLIDYRWGLILETFNSSPRINKKVKIMDDPEIKRKSLNQFKRYLDLENPERYCFICNQVIDEKDISIDHVIPWSYLYSDDLWNLVYVHKSCNSYKSNVIPTEITIEKLKKRNNKLRLIAYHDRISGKAIDELNVAIEKDYVDKFWIGCK